MKDDIQNLKGNTIEVFIDNDHVKEILVTDVFKNSEGKIELCHTLNGSALALPRIVAALLENNQTPEGIKIPEVLVPYCGFDMIK